MLNTCVKNLKTLKPFKVYMSNTRVLYEIQRKQTSKKSKNYPHFYYPEVTNIWFLMLFERMSFYFKVIHAY